MSVSAPPMWKFTGSPISCVAAHSLSQCREPSGGQPKRSGRWEKMMPRWPLAAQRSISAIDRSMSQNGTAMTGMYRAGSVLQ